MKCRDLQFILPLYPDNVLSEAEQALADQHLDSCPVCRQKVADHKEIRNAMRSAPRPQMPAAALERLRHSVAARLDTTAGRQMFQNVGDRRRWVDVWLMPFALGSLTSLIVGFTLLWVIINNEIQPQAGLSPSTNSISNSTILYPFSPPSVPAVSDLNPAEYASSRAAWSQESPSINPHGSLVALTKDLINEVKDEDEVTVVADVYSNGSASIAQVIEPSSDSRVVNQLQHALETETSSAAFVPASFDRRSEPMRVVLKIQSVNVSTRLK